MGVDGFEEDVLDGESELVGGVELAAALGLADVDPVGGAIAGATEALAFAEGFEQDGSEAVAALPVEGQAAGELGQQMGGQVGQVGPGQDGHTIPTLGMRRSPSITGSIRWPGSGWPAWGAAPCAAPPSWWLPTRKESAITFLCG